jgi:sulfide dehydrogenase [flavocytochrome c] flavoprotein subunit
MEMPEPSHINTCYSLVGRNYGISVAAVYQVGKDDKDKPAIVAVKDSGGVSAKDADDGVRSAEAAYAQGWYKNITQEMFA